MTATNRYPAILFDVGSTLLEIVRSPHEFAVEAVAHLGVLSAVKFEAAIRHTVEQWRLDGGPPEVADLPATWIGHNCRALAVAGFNGDIAAAAQIIEATFLSEGLQVYPDVLEVLTALGRHGYKLGVVSNWPATLEATLRRAGLWDYFSVVVGSGNVGYAKPHPRIFKFATDQMGINPREALYVGDSVEHDVAGARAAGMDVVLLDRSGTLNVHEPRIRSLVELLGLLQISS